ncbi:NYN domain-containing protein [Bordetella genomosp. 10]|uniref:NYN domain-containing protein n=1 Tax=Bordetella genomosp. 10 TaxID=1416804 RepID=UPI001178A079|nr:NYN domain-containing protein [Bordetella genomosp. 10]
MSHEARKEQSQGARIQPVSAFVDWNSQIYINGEKLRKDPIMTAQLTLEKTVARIARCLNKVDRDGRFRVQIRLYHGWHKGYEPTINRKAITTALASISFADLSPIRNIVFDSNVAYGDCLLHALSSRLHTRLGIHLPNTLQLQHGVLGEKMVDTALAADVVSNAATQTDEWIVVVAEDDDLVPPVFTAEALLSKTSSRILMLQNRKRSGNFLNLENIMVKM